MMSEMTNSLRGHYILFGSKNDWRDEC